MRHILIHNNIVVPLSEQSLNEYSNLLKASQNIIIPPENEIKMDDIDGFSSSFEEILQTFEGKDGTNTTHLVKVKKEKVTVKSNDEECHEYSENESMFIVHVYIRININSY